MQPQSPQLRSFLNSRPGQPPSGPYLAYLFVAEFSDDHIISQTPEDKSEIDPSKSAYYDVVQYQQTAQLTRFHLTDGEHWYTVDLSDGLFEIGGFPFAAHDQFFEPSKHPLKLVYFREVRAARLSDGTQTHAVNRYFIGWETKVKGEKIKQTIAIS